MNSLIVGYGEIGRALEKVLVHYYQVWNVDKDGSLIGRGVNGYGYINPNPKFEILHICFGYSDEFISEVKRYQELYKPKYTVIHSTVPVGTCREIDCYSIHSPCIGQHPFLEEGLRTFPKMLGGEWASQVADYFRRAGLKVVLFDKQETTESAKLFLTEYYRECINFTKRVKTYCDKHDLSFHEIYTIPNEIYNSGYKKLGYEEFVRPILQPIMTPISGHCVEPNKLLIKLSENENG